MDSRLRRQRQRRPTSATAERVVAAVEHGARRYLVKVADGQLHCECPYGRRIRGSQEARCCAHVQLVVYLLQDLTRPRRFNDYKVALVPGAAQREAIEAALCVTLVVNDQTPEISSLMDDLMGHGKAP